MNTVEKPIGSLWRWNSQGQYGVWKVLDEQRAECVQPHPYGSAKQGDRCYISWSEKQWTPHEDPFVTFVKEVLNAAENV